MYQCVTERRIECAHPATLSGEREGRGERGGERGGRGRGERGRRERGRRERDEEGEIEREIKNLRVVKILELHPLELLHHP